MLGTNSESSKGRFLVAGLAAAGVMAVAANHTLATITVFTNLASFQAAAGSIYTEDLESQPVGNFAPPTSSTFGPVSFQGFSISGNPTGDNIGIETTATANSGPNYPVPAPFAGQKFLSWSNVDGNNGPQFTINFGASITSFGFDWFNTDVTDQYKFTVNDGVSTTLYSGPPFTYANNGAATSGFFGIVSTLPLNSIFFDNVNQQGGYVSDEGMDNFRVSTSALPEPASLAGLALGATALLRRRSRA